MPLILYQNRYLWLCWHTLTILFDCVQLRQRKDLSAAQEVVAKDMAVGTLVITHLTQQDLRAKEILLPKQAVEANILPALTYPLLKFKVLPTAFANCLCPLAFRLSLSLQLFLVDAGSVLCILLPAFIGPVICNFALHNQLQPVALVGRSSSSVSLPSLPFNCWDGCSFCRQHSPTHAKPHQVKMSTLQHDDSHIPWNTPFHV